jgi:hypothetical protein
MDKNHNIAKGSIAISRLSDSHIWCYIREQKQKATKKKRILGAAKEKANY